MPVSPGGSFPQIADNRSRNELERDLASYVGGEDESELRTRAGRSLDDAVREFNAVLWKFNRMVEDITLEADEPDYDLLGEFHHPLRAVMLDANGKERFALEWVDFPVFAVHYVSQTTGSDPPSQYTIRNVHQTGKVTFNPRPVAPTTGNYPTARIHYFRRISLPSGGDSRLNVPAEVEAAIFKRALANFLHKMRNASEAAPVEALALDLKAEVYRLWRDYPDA